MILSLFHGDFALLKLYVSIPLSKLTTNFYIHFLEEMQYTNQQCNGLNSMKMQLLGKSIRTVGFLCIHAMLINIQQFNIGKMALNLCILFLIKVDLLLYYFTKKFTKSEEVIYTIILTELSSFEVPWKCL